MKINLLTKEHYDRLVKIQKTVPALTYNHKGYEGLPRKLQEEHKELIKEIEGVLQNCVYGFSSFTNFCVRKRRKDGKETAVIRLQYDYGADDGSRSFIGVGYVQITELLNGFD